MILDYDISGALFMNISHLSNEKSLDNIRLNDGSNRLKDYFDQNMSINSLKLIYQLNDESLHFATLYVLLPELKKHNLINRLNNRNKDAINIINIITNSKITNTKKALYDYTSQSYSTLKWIFDTGHQEDGVNDDYDEIMDRVCSILIKYYKDKTILNTVIKMIFNRNRKGYYTHDLIWALFESKDTEILIQIAKYIKSDNKEDIKLAKKLLSFIPNIDELVLRNQYQQINTWLKENKSFISFTGEYFQQTNSPIPYEVSHESKYFCTYYDNNSKLHNKLDNQKQKTLDSFSNLKVEYKELLSDFSFRLYKSDKSKWNLWIELPLIQQIYIAVKNII